MAKTLFDVAIELKRVEIIADDKEEIVEATRRLSERYDLVVTSGGLGPTLDDLTYPALAKAFHNEELEYHDETIRRMGALSKRKVDPAEQTEAQRKARNR